MSCKLSSMKHFIYRPMFVMSALSVSSTSLINLFTSFSQCILSDPFVSHVHSKSQLILLSLSVMHTAYGVVQFWLWLLHLLLGSLGDSGVWERSRSSTYKLEEHSQQGLAKDGNHLGGSGGGSSKQIRMASKCGPMHPLGCGLNQGQGHLDSSL